MSLEEKVQKLEEELKQLKQLKKPKRDFWDIFQIVSALLIPASITFLGLYYTDVNSQKEQEISRMNSQVNQAQLISTFLDPLMSTDSVKKAIAINAILIGIPNQGKMIVEVLSRSMDIDNSTRNSARNAIDTRRTTLIKTLYSEQKSDRVNAADDLIRNWNDDPKVLEEMITAANLSLRYEDYYPDRANGLYNCVVVMNNLNQSLLKKYDEELLELFDQIPESYTLTRDVSQEIIGKIKNE
jgi:hypothetical protein